MKVSKYLFPLQCLALAVQVRDFCLYINKQRSTSIALNIGATLGKPKRVRQLEQNDLEHS